MRVLTIDEMMMVSGGIDEGGTRLGTISISRDDNDSRAGGNGGHSVSGKTNKDPVTGFPVLPGVKEDKNPAPPVDLKNVEINLGIPGVAGATITFEPKKRESHN